VSPDAAAARKHGRRVALTLAAAQAIVGSAAPISISIGGLAGMWLLAADKSLATAPVTAFNVGVAIGALPAALLMRAVGRRNGFVSGALMTSLGGAVAAIALFQQNFWIFALGLLVVGCGGSFVQQYRFAAADNALPAFRPKAISWVLGGGVFAAIIGPQAVVWTRNLFFPIEFAGAFVAMIALGLIGALILSTLKMGREANVDFVGQDEAERPLLMILTQFRFLVAFACGVGSYALMSFVMTGAPIAMVGCGFSADEAAVGISFHVMAMFAPSFLTGRLIARFGKERIVAAGFALLVGCAVVALSGIALWQFWVALVLLGVGWNFSFIGSTAMLTDCYRLSEKNKVQGVHDFLLFSTVAFASLMSGFTLNAYGWSMLNWVVFPVVVTCLVLLGLLVVTSRRSSVPQPGE
jgi:MFS family permease